MEGVVEPNELFVVHLKGLLWKLRKCNCNGGRNGTMDRHNDVLLGTRTVDHSDEGYGRYRN